MSKSGHGTSRAGSAFTGTSSGLATVVRHGRDASDQGLSGLELAGLHQILQQEAKRNNGDLPVTPSPFITSPHYGGTNPIASIGNITPGIEIKVA